MYLQILEIILFILFNRFFGSIKLRNLSFVLLFENFSFAESYSVCFKVGDNNDETWAF